MPSMATCPVNKSLIKDYSVKHVCDFDPQPVDIIIIYNFSLDHVSYKNWVCSADKLD